jgi:hypothetical protein
MGALGNSRKFENLPVVDAKSPVVITITKNDIERADRKEPADCALARACRRELHAKEARIHLGTTYLRMNEGNWVRYRTSAALRTEIIAFDRGGTFEPGEYRLTPKPPSQKLGADRRDGPRLKRGKPRRPPHIVTGVRTRAP